MKTTFKMFLEAGKVHQVGDRLPGRGAPEEKARAFDKIHRKRGPVVNRSVLRKAERNVKFSPIEYYAERDYTAVLVMNDYYGEHHNAKYTGIYVSFNADGTITYQAEDPIAEAELNGNKAKILQAAKDGLVDPDFENGHSMLGGHSSEYNDIDDDDEDPNKLITDPVRVRAGKDSSPSHKKLVDAYYWNDRVPKAHRINVRGEIDSLFDE